MRPILSFLAQANHCGLKDSHCLGFSTLTDHRSFVNYELIRAPLYVCWDLDACRISRKTCMFDLREWMYEIGHLYGVRAFGDVLQIPRTKQDDLHYPSCHLYHFPLKQSKCGKNSVYESIINSLKKWVSRNPPPAHILLISKEEGFSGTLHKLRMSNYNILVATGDGASNELCSAANIMWQWSSLRKGDYLSGKLVNQPLDGPCGVWYDRYNDQYKASVQAFNEMKSYFNTSEAAGVLSQSRTSTKPGTLVPAESDLPFLGCEPTEFDTGNEDSYTLSQLVSGLVKNLREQKPPVLKLLYSSDLERLLKLLISDKKWMMECSSETFRFWLAQLD